MCLPCKLLNQNIHKWFIKIEIYRCLIFFGEITLREFPCIFFCFFNISKCSKKYPVRGEISWKVISGARILLWKLYIRFIMHSNFKIKLLKVFGHDRIKLFVQFSLRFNYLKLFSKLKNYRILNLLTSNVKIDPIYNCILING